MNCNKECAKCRCSISTEHWQRSQSQPDTSPLCAVCAEAQNPPQDSKKSPNKLPAIPLKVLRAEHISVTSRLLTLVESNTIMQGGQYLKIGSPPLAMSPNALRSKQENIRQSESFANITSFAEVSRKLSRLNSIGSKKVNVSVNESKSQLRISETIEQCKVHNKKLKALCLEEQCKIKVCSYCGLYGVHKVSLAESSHRPTRGVRSRNG
jgi:hypothetical protein